MGFCAVDFWLVLTHGESQQQETEQREEKGQAPLGLAGSLNQWFSTRKFLTQGTFDDVQRHFWLSQLVCEWHISG